MKAVIASDIHQHFNLGSLRLFGVSYPRFIAELLARVPQIKEIVFLDAVQAHRRHMGDVQVQFVPRTGTVGDMRELVPHLGDAPFLFITGNTVPGMDIQRLILPHLNRPAAITCFAQRRNDRAGYYFCADDQGVVSDIGYERRDWGLYCDQIFMVDPAALTYATDTSYLWYESLLTELLKRGKKIQVIEHTDPVRQLQSPDDLYAAHYEFPRENTWSHLLVDEEAQILHSCLADQVQVGAQTRIIDSVIMRNTHIGKNCDLEHCLIGENVIIEDNTRLPKYAIIPKSSHITALGGVLRV